MDILHEKVNMLIPSNTYFITYDDQLHINYYIRAVNYITNIDNNPTFYIISDNKKIQAKAIVLKFIQYMKNKHCNKVSIITDSKFIPIDIQIFKGNLNDSNILQQQFTNIDTFMNNTKYFICDKGYCSSKIRNILTNKNISDNRINIHSLINNEIPYYFLNKYFV